MRVEVLHECDRVRDVGFGLRRGILGGSVVFSTMEDVMHDEGFGFNKKKLTRWWLRKGGCSGMGDTPIQDNVAIKDSRARKPLDSTRLAFTRFF